MAILENGEVRAQKEGRRLNEMSKITAVEALIFLWVSGKGSKKRSRAKDRRAKKEKRGTNLQT